MSNVLNLPKYCLRWCSERRVVIDYNGKDIFICRKFLRKSFEGVGGSSIFRNNISLEFDAASRRLNHYEGMLCFCFGYLRLYCLRRKLFALRTESANIGFVRRQVLIKSPKTIINLFVWQKMMSRDCKQMLIGIIFLCRSVQLCLRCLKSNKSSKQTTVVL